MILALAMAVSVVLALLQGGKLTRLSHIPLRCGWLAILSFFIQISVIYSTENRVSSMATWKQLVIPISYSMILAVSILNIKLPGIALVSMGLALNMLVMSVNGGFMPVTFDALRRAGLAHMALGIENGARLMASKDIILSREATRLWLLSDVLVLGKPFPWGTVFSVGDVFLMSGAWILLNRALRFPASQTKSAS